VAEGVLLSWLSGGLNRNEFTLCALASVIDPACPVASYDGELSGPDLKSTRNDQAARFLATDLDWLLMVDTDMVFLPGAVAVLLKAADPVERPVVGGLCFQQVGKNQITPTMNYVRRLDDGGFVFRTVDKWPEDELVQVDATGTAFLLIHRTVFGRISVATGENRLWFAEIVESGRQFSEDFCFCLRCAAAGIPVFVHTGVKVGHLKTTVYGDISLPGS
jgi:GT2 family glycosyltransferase